MSRALILDLDAPRQAIGKSLDGCDLRFGREVDLGPLDSYWSLSPSDALDVAKT